MKTARVGYRDHLLALALAAVTLAVFWRVGGFGFVNFDDDVYVYENPEVLAGLTGKSVVWALTATYRATWQPLTWLSYMIGVEIHGAGPRGFHLVNLGLHIAGVVLLFYAFRLMTGDSWRSGFVAAVLALHPLQVEPVAWIASRKDVLSTLFGMLTIFCYARYVKRPSIARFVPVFAALGLGLMSKQALVTLPFVLLLLDYFPLNRLGLKTDRKANLLRATWPVVREKLPLFGLCAAACMMTAVAHERGGTFASWESVSLPYRVGTASVSYLAYIGKLLWPADLAVFYPHPGMTLSIPAAVTASVLLVAVTAVVLWRARRSKYLAVGWLWFVGTLVPVIGFVQVGGHAMADRFMYVPGIGLALLLAWGAGDLAAKLGLWRRAPGILGGLAVLAMGVCTWFQIGHWSNSIKLFEHAISVTKNNYLAHTNLAGAFEDKGRLADAVAQHEHALKIRDDAQMRYNLAVTLHHQAQAQGIQSLLDKAEGHYLTALRIDPEHVDANHDLGALLFKKGKIDEAIAHYLTALRLKPEHASAHNSLGLAYAAQGRFDEAVGHYEESARLAPQFADTHLNLGVALVQLGEVEEAIGALRASLKLDQRSPFAHYRLAVILDQQGDLDQAVSHYGQAYNLRPGWLAPALRLVWLLAADGHAAYRNPRAAVQMAELACQWTKGNHAPSLDALAMAQAAAGRFDEAVETAKKAIEKARAGGNITMSEAIEQRLGHYRAGRSAAGASVPHSP